MKNVLVVVDMQNDFVTGALGSKDAENIVLNVKNKIKEYLKRKDLVVFTRDTHQEDYLETHEGKHLPVKHCIEGTKGWNIIPELEEYVDDENVIDKPTFGSFDLVSHLMSLDEEYEINQIEFIGLCTDICVISNVMLTKASFYDYDIVVDSSCCAGVSVSSHNNALEAMKMCHIKVL